MHNWVNYYLSIHLVPRFPTLIICGTIFSIAFVIQIAGIILDSLLAQDKRNFEFKLNIVQNWFKSKKKKAKKQESQESK